MNQKENDKKKSLQSSPYLVIGLHVLLLVLTALPLYFQDLGVYGFYETWEGIYAQSAREMAERGNYLIPWYRGYPRLAKPVLVYWGILFSNLFIGGTEFSARLPGPCTALLGTLCIYYAFLQLKNRTTAFIVSMVLLTSSHFYMFARRSTPDIYIITFTGTTIAFLMLSIFKEKWRAFHVILAGFSMGLGFLGKGPIAVVCPMLGIIIWLASTLDFDVDFSPRVKNASLLGLVLILAAGISAGIFLFFHASFYMKDYLDPPFWLDHLQKNVIDAGLFSQEEGVSILYYLPVLLVSGVLFISGALVLKRIIIENPQQFERVFHKEKIKKILVFTILFFTVFSMTGLPWYVYILFSTQGEFGENFIISYNLEAFVAKVSHSETSTYYVKSIVFGFFPWYAILPVVFVSLMKVRKDGTGVEKCPETFILCCIVSTAGFFCLATTKFYHYIVPVVPIMAMGVGTYLGKYLEEKQTTLHRIGMAAAFLFTLPTARSLLRYNYHHMNKLFAVWPHYEMPRIMQKPMVIVSDYVFALLLVSLLTAAFTRFRKTAVAGLMISSILFGHFYIQKILIPLGNYRSPKEVLEIYHRDHRNSPVYFFGSYYQPNTFYTNDRMENLENNLNRFLQLMGSDDRIFCLVKRGGDYQKIRLALDKQDKKMHIIFDDGERFLLVSNQP